MTQLITHVSPQSLTDVLQEAGYRVNQSEQNGIVQLLSASQGIGYAVRLGNPAVEQGSFVDFTFSCALRVQGEFLVMEMDVVVAAGVSNEHLRGNLELWDRLLQEFIVYLRDFSQATGVQTAKSAIAEQEEVTL